MPGRLTSLATFCARKVKKQFLAKTPSVIVQQIRNLQVHEHVAQSLLKEAGIPVAHFGVAKTPEEAEKIAKDLKSKDLVLKAQVLAGGRGKGHFKGSDVSGVVMCESPEQVKEISSKMLGKLLVTKQTGENGRICNAVMVTTRMFPRKEYYIAVMLEREFDGPVVIVSKQGGVNIEDVAAANPEAVTYLPINIFEGLTIKQMDHVVDKLGIPSDSRKTAAMVVCNLYEMFIQKDALLVEINPFAEDKCGDYFALDCKCNFDGSAEYRQKELFSFDDKSQKDPAEVKAEKHNLNFIRMDGNIGCMVNGAGLAMATMDIIKLYGGSPANFLDISGGATKETAAEALKIITEDPKVQTIFINIFGGIIRCDEVAKGIVAAIQEAKLDIPIITRLQGTNADKAKELIIQAKLNIISEDDLANAAKMAVKMSMIADLANSMNIKINFLPKKDKDSKKPSKHI